MSQNLAELLLTNQLAQPSYHPLALQLALESPRHIIVLVFTTMKVQVSLVEEPEPLHALVPLDLGGQLLFGPLARPGDVAVVLVDKELLGDGVGGRVGPARRAELGRVGRVALVSPGVPEQEGAAVGKGREVEVEGRRRPVLGGVPDDVAGEDLGGLDLLARGRFDHHGHRERRGVSVARLIRGQRGRAGRGGGLAAVETETLHAAGAGAGAAVIRGSLLGLGVDHSGERQAPRGCVG